MISVIVPVYNVENYLPKCIDSIINQTYKELEIILVDDGSTDLSGKICDDYAKKDSRIRVIHQINGGLSAARNTGLNLCSGEFISFVDSDDYLEITMYEKLINTMQEYDSDIVQCEINKIYLNHIEKTFNDQIKAYDGKDAVKSLLQEEKIRFEVWNKLYKKSCIGDYHFKIGQVHEDIYFTPRVLLNAKKVVCIKEPLYNYLVEREGNTNSNFKKNRLDAFEEFNLLTDLFINSNYLELADITKALALKYCISFYILAYKNNAETDIKEKLLIYYNYYLKNIENYYFNNRLKIFLFKISPNFYSKLFLLKGKLKK